MNNNRSQNITNYNITTNATCVVGAALKAPLLKQTQSTWERPKASGRCLYTAVQSRGCLSLCRTVCNVGGSDHVRDNIRGCVNILRHCICSYQFPGWVCQIFTAVLLLFTQYIEVTVIDRNHSYVSTWQSMSVTLQIWIIVSDKRQYHTDNED